MSEPFEFVGNETNPKIFLTCEHASSSIFEGWGDWPKEDAWVQSMHWAVDIGAEILTRELAEKFKCKGIVAKFSRLLCDCNRPLDSETMFRKVADSKMVELNKNVTEEDRERRLNTLYFPYHQAIDSFLEHSPSSLIFSIHSYTDQYEGTKRDVEAGLLFIEDETLAQKVTNFLKENGVDARLNEPWSGKEGFMYSADMHAKKSNSHALMLEVRQDLLQDESWRHKFVDLMYTCFKNLEYVK